MTIGVLTVMARTGTLIHCADPVYYTQVTLYLSTPSEIDMYTRLTPSTTGGLAGA